MKKIGDVTSTADKNGEFTDGNAASGTPPTQLMGDWFNSVQREIINVLIKAGVTQSKDRDDQLSEAIAKLIGSAGYQLEGYSYSKVESNLKFQPIGNYASADYFAQIGTYSMMESPNHNYRLVIHDDGSVSAHNNTSGGVKIIGFSPSGEMEVGSVPASRVTGLVVNELGQSTTQVMSQKAVTDLAATKQEKGNYANGGIFQTIPGYTFMHSPEKKYRAVIGDDGVFRVIYNAGLNPSTFSFGADGAMESGTIPAVRITGLFSRWLAVSGARTVNTTYTNPRDVPMYIVISLMNDTGEGNIFVKDSSRETQVHYFGSKTTEVSLSVSFMVPPRGEYRMTGTMSIRTWSECF